MKFKEIKQAANIAWSPAGHHPIHFALGTAAQLLDATFSTESSLEIYDLDPTSSSLDLTALGGIKSDFRFHKLVWGCMETKRSETGSDGLIVGGADGGSVLVYDPAKIIKSEENALTCNLTKHTGPVHSLDFNKFQECLLASGASESEIFVWDLNDPVSPITPRFKSQPADYVTSVAWNCQVQHILASTFPSCCVVWDLRKNEPILKVSDSSSKFHCKSVAWHPEVATQLCLASDDDHCPVIQLWDLRFATTPVHNLEGHERGVLAIAWCPHDPELLLSSGKDNKIFCWNPISQPPTNLFSTQCSTQWSFDIAWCPQNPAIISSSSCDGSVGFFSMIGDPVNEWIPANANAPLNFEDQIHSQPHGPDLLMREKSMLCSFTKPPKWMRRPAGASFAFGGKIVSFSNKCSGYPSRLAVCISSIKTEPSILEKTAGLEFTVNCGDLDAYCLQKANSCTNDNEIFQWNFLKAVFNRSTAAKTKLLLGLDNQNVHPENHGNFQFNNVPKNSLEKHEDTFILNRDTENTDDMLCKALLVGNIESAVEICIKATPSRWADALVLANVGGHELVQKTQKLYFNAVRSSSSKLISAIVSSDWLPFIENCAIESWKEALAAILTYSRPEEYPFLCDTLGSRLEERKDFSKYHAALCYISAGNLERLAQLWAKEIETGLFPLQDLIELIIVLRHIIAKLSGKAPCIQSGTLPLLLNRFAALLVSQGNLKSAATYLSYSSEESCVLLLDQIYQALGYEATNSLPKSADEIKKPVHAGTSGFPQAVASNSFSSNSIGFTQPQTVKNESLMQQTDISQYQPCIPSIVPNTGMPPTSSWLPPKGQSSNSGWPHSQRYPKHASDANMYCQPSHGNQPYAYIPPVQQQNSYNASSAQPLNFYNPDPSGNAAFPTAYSSSSFTPPPSYNDLTTAGSVSQSVQPPSEAYTHVPTYKIPSSYGVMETGWNDPPLLKQGAASEHASACYQNLPAPITTPLYGSAADISSMPVNSFPDTSGPPPVQQLIVPALEVQKAYHGNTTVEDENRQQSETPKEKNPIPTEHKVMYDVFEFLRKQCQERAKNPQIRRKLDDIPRKLENLYDMLREKSLSKTVSDGLLQIIYAVGEKDYSKALLIHGGIVSNTNFSEITGFMPSIKTLLQICHQLGVYLQ